MQKAQISLDPVSFSLNSQGSSKISGGPSEGDAPCVRTSIRMPRIDIIGIHSTGIIKPSNHDWRLRKISSGIKRGIASSDVI